MTNWFERSFAQMVCARGAVGVWEVAALAAVWPYVAAPAFMQWGRIDAAASPYTTALSLCITLTLLVGLRAALDRLVQPAAQPGWTQMSDPSATLPVVRPPSAPAPAAGLFNRATLQGLVEDRDVTSPAVLGVIRFANHAPMVAFDAAAAARVMTVFARRLESAIAAKRPAAQIGEDSFAILFDGPGHGDGAEAELGSIAYVLTQEITEGELTVAPDIHVGLARFPEDADTWAGLSSRAGMSAIPLKRFQMAGVAQGARTPGDTPAERFVMEQALRRAVRDGQLSLRYQPFVDTAEGRVAGAEVLLRWRHPVLGEVPPASFVPLLEDTGLIHEIGLWTLNSACRQLSVWRGGGQANFRLAINLSAIQLQTPQLKSVIARTVASHGLAPSDVELELTETAAMEDQVRTIEQLQSLRALGFGIAIDDFGKGHSNLGYLKDLPVTKLKIDREFVDRIDTRASSRAICKAMVELASGLGMSVLAEGVERIEEVETLKRLGCHTFQGFHFARPLTAGEFTQKLADPDWLSVIASDVHRERAELQRRLS